jgi:predicted nucleic acid-binding Zn ribbon protein
MTLRNCRNWALLKGDLLKKKKKKKKKKMMMMMMMMMIIILGTSHIIRKVPQCEI